MRRRPGFSPAGPQDRPTTKVPRRDLEATLSGRTRTSPQDRPHLASRSPAARLEIVKRVGVRLRSGRDEAALHQHRDRAGRRRPRWRSARRRRSPSRRAPDRTSTPRAGGGRGTRQPPLGPGVSDPDGFCPQQPVDDGARADPVLVRRAQRAVTPALAGRHQPDALEVADVPGHRGRVAQAGRHHRQAAVDGRVRDRGAVGRRQDQPGAGAPARRLAGDSVGPSCEARLPARSASISRDSSCAVSPPVCGQTLAPRSTATVTDVEKERTSTTTITSDRSARTFAPMGPHSRATGMAVTLSVIPDGPTHRRCEPGHSACSASSSHRSSSCARSPSSSRSRRRGPSPARGPWPRRPGRRAAGLAVAQPVQLPVDARELLPGGPGRRGVRHRARLARRPVRRPAAGDLSAAARRPGAAPGTRRRRPAASAAGRRRAAPRSGRGALEEVPVVAETTIIEPGQPSSRSSSWVSVSMSRSLVGSSRNSTFGSSISSRSSCSRRRSPPDRSPTGVHCFSLVKPNCSHSWRRGHLPALAEVDRAAHLLDGLQHPQRRVQLGDLLREVRQLHGLADARPARRPAAAVAGEQPQQRGLARAVDARPGRSGRRGRAARSGARAAPSRRRWTVTSSRSKTVLPSRALANFISSAVSRGGGTSAISSFAASIRNRGLRGTRRRPAAQPGQLLADQVLPRWCSSVAAMRSRSARAKTYAV